MNPSFRSHLLIYFILCAGGLCGLAIALRADGEGVVLERLHDLEVLATGAAAIFVGWHSSFTPPT